MELHVLDVRLREYHSEPLHLTGEDFELVGSCPCCETSDRQAPVALSRGSETPALSLAHCENCLHSYLDRRPSERWLQHYYSDAWDTGRTADTKPTGTGLRERLRQQPMLRRMVQASRVARRGLPQTFYPGPARLMSMVAGLGEVPGDEFPADWRVLEVGTGYGASLDFLSEAGMTTYGTEANAHRVAACRARGLEVVQTSIADLDPVTQWAPFDLIYSSHVFEHIADLDGVMRAAAPLVADGGFIYLEVPNSPLSEDVILRTHIPVHLHLFSASSLSALLRRFGFEPVRMLADLNLHVIARKTTDATVIGSATVPSRPSDLSHGLNHLEQGETYEISYDLFHTEIRRARDREMVYKRAFPYGAITGTGANIFTVRVASRAGDFLEFVHPGPQAPLWVKHG